jgi:hypothetical protein
MTSTESATQYAETRVTELLTTPTNHAPHTRWLHSAEERQHLTALLADAYAAGAKASETTPTRG